MDPVETNARTFGDAVQQVATVLTAYAEEIRPIKASLDAVRRDAYAFRDKIASNSEWDYDQDLVDENTDLVNRVNSAQVKLWDAERTCANGIRALYCAAPWHAATSADDPLGYGVSEIPADAPMAWGSSVERQDHCPKSAAVGVKRFVWDGVVVDGLWGTVVGLGALVGIKDWKWSADNFTESWTAMGGLIGYADGEWSWGNAGDSWLALGKGLIAYDTWEDDPARAAGGAVFNIATIVIPAGAAVSGTKAAATAAGTTGRAAALLSKGARIVDFLDPVSLVIKGGQFALPKLGDLLTGMRGATEGLEGALRIPDVPTNLDLPTSNLDDLADGLPPLRDPDAEVPTVHEPVEVPVPANQLVGPDGNPIRDTPGGTGSGADDLAGPQAPPAGPIHTPGTDAPTGGSSHGPSTGDGAGTGGSTTPPSGGGHAPATPIGGGSGGPVDPVTPTGPGSGPVDPVAPHDPSSPAGGPPPPTPPGTGLGSSPSGPELKFTDVLDDVLLDNGLNRTHFRELLQTRVEDLTRAQVDVLVDIRQAMPPVYADTLLQKVITQEQALGLLDGDAARFMEPDQLAAARASGAQQVPTIGGFVSRLIDVDGATPAQLYHQLGLNYPGSTFSPDGGSVFTVRYMAGDGIAPGPLPTPVVAGIPDGTLRAMASMPDSIFQITNDAARRTAMFDWVRTVDPSSTYDAARAFDVDRATGVPNVGPDRNPFRGSGWSGTSSAYSPELAYGSNKIQIIEGSELWRVRPDGTQEIAAVYTGGVWRVVP
ncbi:hypothetical protein ASE38_03775 [Cellulomonas sp. Root930]|nr:hypothetical protein ASE38_03775 [Cellulomonas sp. Root930]